MLAPGEAVLNRHQQAVVEKLLGSGFLDKLFASVNRPHYMARGGIVPVPGFPGESAASSVIGKILAIARRFGLTLTDAFGPGHQSPGHTRFGTAADFAGSDRSMDRAVRYLTRQGYLVGYDGRFGSQKWPGHGPSYVAGSNAHLHVELASSGVGLGGAAPHIKGVKTRVPGAVGAIVQRALDISRSGAQGVANRAAMSALSSPIGGGGGGGMSKGQIKNLWVRAGGDPARANLMAAIALAESGGQAGIVNSIGATGLWQIHPGGSQYLNPLANARAAVGKFRTQGLGAWEAYTNGAYRQFLNRGGRVHAARGLAPNRQQLAGRVHGRHVTTRRIPHHAPYSPGINAQIRNIDAYIELAESKVAVAELNGNKSDERYWLNFIRRLQRKRLRLAERSRIPGLISESAQALGTTRDTIAGLTPEVDKPTAEDFLARDTAMAALTPDTGDDIGAATRTRDYYQGAEGAHGRADRLSGIEQKRANDLAAQMGSSGEFQVRKLFAEVMSGQFGRGIVGRSFTPGSGAVAAY
jgi:hypothetical protein